MADGPDADQKTEAPTSKRRRDSAARGEALQARELATALVIGTATLWLLTASRTLAAVLATILRQGLASAGPRFDPGTAVQAALRPLALPALLFVAYTLIGALATPLLSARRWAPGAALPKWSRVDPVAGFGRIFGARILTDVPLAALKALLLGGIGWVVVGDALPRMLRVAGAETEVAGASIAAAIGQLFLLLTGGLLVIAGIDFPVQLLRYLGKLRMSRQEVRDENRESEGSPETRAAQRAQSRRLAKQALGPALKDATVVVTNPTEFAVALRYAPPRDAAPVVVARGRGPIAQAIRELATDAAVPLLRYPALTRSIYFSTKVGEPIRDELYAAVAAVLAFVFNLERQVAAETAADPPAVDVPASLRFDERGRAGG